MWTEAETWVLIRLWEDHLPQLRGEKHNARVYDAIVVALAQNGIVRTRRQVQTKIDNLTQRYRSFQAWRQAHVQKNGQICHSLPMTAK
ncbi:myb/SANT-like DNA-binding domain-containing protein 1 [Rhipicephalus sanguineus]|uniref:myb/SANT-like DNA-binding domain-containing protein 1 n=1 Tax=Rhipicephalus sanguineus TaxID=34632 RepID=UPI0018945FA4|nr:myb/SANT-like DNA-binding domain-containing protein 1 [Rhipicephalus sanguineus]